MPDAGDNAWLGPSITSSRTRSPMAGTLCQIPRDEGHLDLLVASLVFAGKMLRLSPTSWRVTVSSAPPP